MVLYKIRHGYEADAHTPFGDRRFLESAGPFTLQPGAVNYVTTGLVWDQSPTANSNLLPIALIQQDADLAQVLLFNNCFKVLDGPRCLPGSYHTRA